MKKRSNLRTLIFTALCTALIAVCAQITIPLQIIPFTLQTMAVFLTAAILGARWGTVSVAVYLLMGLCGLPVFSGFKGGPAALFGPTGGYLLGFLCTSVISGFLYARFHKYFWQRFLGMTAGLLLCYLFGTIWFVLVYSRNVEPIGWTAALMKCVVPFLVPDGVKIAVSAAAAPRLQKLMKRSDVR